MEGESWMDIQIYQRETWKALLRCITSTVEMCADASKIEQIYKNGVLLRKVNR